VFETRHFMAVDNFRIAQRICLTFVNRAHKAKCNEWVIPDNANVDTRGYNFIESYIHELDRRLSWAYRDPELSPSPPDPRHDDL
jgi:hypothetical protein